MSSSRPVGERAEPSDTADGGRTFLEEVFAPLHRAEQRRWARTYLWGLIHAPGRRTPANMARAGRLPPSAANSLHQFVSTSPWAWEPVRRRLAGAVAAGTTPYAWTVADLLIPKRGEHSVGVHRRADPRSGRIVNGQQAVGLFLVTDTHCFPVDWTLVLGGPWGWDTQRRVRARIPKEETARPVGACVLDHAARYAGPPGAPGLPVLSGLPWVLDLTHSEDAGGVLAGLARHRVDVLCEVAPRQAVLAGGRTPVPTTVGALRDRRGSWRGFPARRPAVTGPDGRPLFLYTHSGTVRLPPRAAWTDGGPRAYRLLDVPEADGSRGSRFWVTNLGDAHAERVAELLRGPAAVRSAVAALQDGFGMVDFEGRSFPGWHHHMTMTSVAYAYAHLGRRPAPGTAPPGERGPAAEAGPERGPRTGPAGRGPGPGSSPVPSPAPGAVRAPAAAAG
ncbi:transposase [Streptomyces sp. NPDC058417]|uniref:IS701 family transposase n=1 Tax=unclassified Streptomyces TaxID=2593676 RepID=UPI003657D1E1